MLVIVELYLAGKYEKRLLKFLFVFCQVTEKAEFISGGLRVCYLIHTCVFTIVRIKICMINIFQF